MIFLVNHRLPPILQFMCGSVGYSDVLYSLWSSDLVDYEIEEIESFSRRKGFVLNSKYFFDPKVLKKWIRRLEPGRLNVEVFDNDALVFSYYCSEHGITKTYEVEEISGIKMIDYSFIKSRYPSFRSRSKNAVALAGEVVKKSSSDIKKIVDEYSFMRNCAESFDFYPLVFNLENDNSTASYQMPLISPGDTSSYYLNNDLEFFIGSQFSEFGIHYFREAISKLEQSSQDNQKAEVRFSEKLRKRMHARREEFDQSITGITGRGDLTALYIESLHNELVERVEKLFVSGDFEFVNHSALGVFHGDFCLSNILYDSKLKQFFLVDPRGDSSLPVCMDLAKLAHSFHGGYDLILAGHYRLNLTAKGLILDLDIRQGLSDIFFAINDELKLHTTAQVVLLEVYLFLTMIKFHREDLSRCLAFLVRSRDLLNTWCSGTSLTNVH